MDAQHGKIEILCRRRPVGVGAGGFPPPSQCHGNEHKAVDTWLSKARPVHGVCRRGENEVC